jgi:hypothetical protein
MPAAAPCARSSEANLAVAAHLLGRPGPHDERVGLVVRPAVDGSDVVLAHVHAAALRVERGLTDEVERARRWGAAHEANASNAACRSSSPTSSLSTPRQRTAAAHSGGRHGEQVGADERRVGRPCAGLVEERRGQVHAGHAEPGGQRARTRLSLPVRGRRGGLARGDSDEAAGLRLDADHVGARPSMCSVSSAASLRLISTAVGRDRAPKRREVPCVAPRRRRWNGGGTFGSQPGIGTQVLLEAGEPAAGPWAVLPIVDLAGMLLEAAGPVSRRPRAFRPPAWEARRRRGAIEVPTGASLLIVEGVGAGRRETADHVDAIVWVQSDVAVRNRREAARVAAGESDADVSERWMREEIPFVAGQRPWERALVVVAGTPSEPHDPHTKAVVAPPPAVG